MVVRKLGKPKKRGRPLGSGKKWFMGKLIKKAGVGGSRRKARSIRKDGKVRKFGSGSYCRKAAARARKAAAAAASGRKPATSGRKAPISARAAARIKAAAARGSKVFATGKKFADARDKKFAARIKAAAARMGKIKVSGQGRPLGSGKGGRPLGSGKGLYKGKPTKSPVKALRTKTREEERSWHVTELLAECRGEVTASCAEMLRLALPYALGTPKEERHSFQNSIIGALSALHMREEQSRCEALERKEDEVAGLINDKDDAEEQVDEARADSSEKLNDRAGVAEACRHKADAVDAAVAALENEQAQEAKAQDFKHTVAELWEPLSSFSLQDERGGGQAVNSAVDEISACLQEAEAPPSLVAALRSVLHYSGAAERQSEYAKQAIEHAGAALTAHSEKLEAASQGPQGITPAAAAAQAQLQKAIEERDQATQSSVGVQKIWAEADSKVYQLEAIITDFARKQTVLIQARNQQVAALGSFRGRVATFEQLVHDDVRAQAAGAGAAAEAGVGDPPQYGS